VPWFEVHAENYMGGGPAVRLLERLRSDYPLSIHGVGLSLGSADGLDLVHLQRLRDLVQRFAPAFVSEHLAWSSTGGAYLNHLLPVPYTEETLALITRHVDQVQAVLGRQLLVENPSLYLRFAASYIPEAEFLGELVQRTGCGLLCDVNNIYVTCQNFAQDPVAYLTALPAHAIGEIHLAGHAVNDADGHTILIDDHGAPVSAPVWQLYALALARFGLVPTLIEWDTNIPDLAVLLAEAQHAETLMLQASAGGQAHVA
jgi:uncharacterized protein (UPF0276 family)